MLRTALGAAISAYLEDPSIVEVMLNPDGRLWIDRLAGGLEETGCYKLSPSPFPHRIDGEGNQKSRPAGIPWAIPSTMKTLTPARFRPRLRPAWKAAPHCAPSLWED
jgi:hypothetical protein